MTNQTHCTKHMKWLLVMSPHKCELPCAQKLLHHPSKNLQSKTSICLGTGAAQRVVRMLWHRADPADLTSAVHRPSARQAAALRAGPSGAPRPLATRVWHPAGGGPAAPLRSGCFRRGPASGHSGKSTSRLKLSLPGGRRQVRLRRQLRVATSSGTQISTSIPGHG